MPLSRYQICNQYGLGKRELYGAANQDDPEAVLQGVAVAGLTGILRQLGDLTELAAEIFHDLHEEIITTAARGNKLTLRVQQLEAEFPSAHKGLCPTDYSCVTHNMGTTNWQANLKIDQGLVTNGDMPRFIMQSYKECREPPQLFRLDKFDVAGVGACLKRYSDPSSFKSDSASYGMLLEDNQREMRASKVTNTGLNWTNAELSYSDPLNNANSKLGADISDQDPDEVSHWRVKLKHKQMNGLLVGSFRSHIQNFLEMDSPEHRDNSISYSADASNKQAVRDSPANDEALPVKALVQSGEMPQSSTSSKRDRNDIFSDDESKTEEHSADSFSGDIQSNSSTTQMHLTDVLPDNGSDIAGSSNGYTSDGASELDIYLDALATMESEVETDSETESRLRRVLARVKSLRNYADTNGKQHDLQDGLAEEISVRSSVVLRMSKSFKKGIAIPYHSDASDNGDAMESPQEDFTGRDLLAKSDSASTLSHTRSSGSLDNTQKPIHLKNVTSKSFKKISSRKVRYLDTEDKGRRSSKKLSKNYDPFSDSLRHMAKQLLELKHDAPPHDVHSEDMGLGEEYESPSLDAIDSLHSVLDNSVLKEHPSEYVKKESDFVAHLEGLSPVGSSESPISEESNCIAHDFDEGKPKPSRVAVELPPQENELQEAALDSGEVITVDTQLPSNEPRDEVIKEPVQASNLHATISDAPDGVIVDTESCNPHSICSNDTPIFNGTVHEVSTATSTVDTHLLPDGPIQVSDFLGGMSNALDDELQIKKPFDGTSADNVSVDADEESYDPSPTCSNDTPVLNRNVQEANSAHEATSNGEEKSGLFEDATKVEIGNATDIIALRECYEKGDLPAFELDNDGLQIKKPFDGTSADYVSVDADKESYGPCPICSNDTPVLNGNVQEENTAHEATLNGEENDSPFEDATKVEIGDTADNVALQGCYEKGDLPALELDKTPVEEKSICSNFTEFSAEQIPKDVLEIEDSSDSKASLRPLCSLVTEDISSMKISAEAHQSLEASELPAGSKLTINEPSDQQGDKVVLCDYIDVPCNSSDIMSKATEAELELDLHAVFNDHDIDKLGLPLLEKVVCEQLQTNKSVSVICFQNLCSSPDSDTGFSNTGIDGMVQPPSNEPICSAEICEDPLLSDYTEKPPYAFASIAPPINQTDQFLDEQDCKRPLQDNESSGDAEALPPLPPLQWRQMKIQLAPLASRTNARPPIPKPPKSLPATRKKPLQGLQPKESERANRRVPLLPMGNKISVSNSSSFQSTEKALSLKLSSPLLIHHENCHYDENRFQESSVEDQKNIHDCEPYDEYSPSLALSHAENEEASELPEPTLDSKDVASELHEIHPILENESTIDVPCTDKEMIESAEPAAVSDTEDGEHQLSNGVPSGEDLQLPILAKSEQGEEHKISEDDSLCMHKDPIPISEAEKPRKEHPPIPIPPRCPMLQVTSHDRSMLKKVPSLVQPSNKLLADERNTLLEQIRNKSFSLKPAIARRPNIMGPQTNLKLVAILERANAIRQAMADDDDDDDSWSDS